MTVSSYSQPLPLPRAVLRRRLEVFSPKLGRRASLGSYDAWRCWVALEANPAVERFCERPARIAGPNTALIDFWVKLKADRLGEFWVIERHTDVGPADEPESSIDYAAERLRGLPVRVITQALISSWQVPLGNWAQILPYLVSFRGHRDELLEQSIIVLLSRPVCLDDILGHFRQRDPSQVQASLYALVANGRALSEDLAAAPIGGATRFRRA